MGVVLVTGGAGFLGINIIRYLRKKGYKKIRSMDIAPFDYPEKSSVECITADIRDTKAVERCMENVSFVIHTAAALPLYSKEDIFSIDVTGTQNLCESASRHKVKRFIHISSTAVYGIPDHHPLRETDKLDGVGPYGKAKIQAEEVCMKYRAEGMCVPILRPKSFIGPERLGVFALFYDWASTGHGFPMVGNGKNRYQFLDVEDLCQAIHLCMTAKESLVDDVFNVGANQFTTMRQDFQAVLDVAGFGKKVSCFPAWPMIFTLRFLELLRLSPLYKWVYETASKDSFVSIEKIEKTLGFKPEYSNQQALVRNYRWYLANLHQFQNVSGVSHRVPWKQGILKLLKVFF